MVLLIVFIIVFLNKYVIEDFSNTELLKANHEVSVKVEKNSYVKGFIKLNDKLYISINTPMVNKKEGMFGKLADVNPPFKLEKLKNSKQILVIKDNDTIFFKLIDYSRDAIEDPTFKDLYETIFKNK